MAINVQGGDLPAGMVSIGGALAGFLTELEERSGPQNRVPYGTKSGKLKGTRTTKAPAMLSTSEGVND